MAGVSKYSDADRTRVNAALRINDGNVRRTARETGIPVATVRDWKRNWENTGVPAVIEAQTGKAVEKFIADAMSTRDLAMSRLREVIPTETKAQALATVVGILDDKINRAQTGPQQVSQSQTNIFIGGDADAVRDQFAKYAITALDSSRQREQDILQADVITDAIEVSNNSQETQPGS